MEETVFLCGEEFEDIMSGIYDAWTSRLGHDKVKLESEKNWQPRLFCQYRRVETDLAKVQKVVKAYESYERKEAAARPERQDADQRARFAGRKRQGRNVK